MKDDRPKILDDIIFRLKKNGKAKYDFGTFYLYKRKGYSTILPNGKKEKVADYTAVFFRSSKALKRNFKMAKKKKAKGGKKKKGKKN